MLIIEDDPAFARVMLDLARAQGFKGVVASSGEEGLELARQLSPDAVTLDIRLPDTSGWTVLERLKREPQTRHIPVHVISVESHRQHSLHLGAVTCLQKPVKKEQLEQTFEETRRLIDRRVKTLLLVEDNAAQRKAIVELIGNGDVKTTAVATGKEALAALDSEHFDCMVVDLGLKGMSGFSLIERTKEQPALKDLPIIVYTGKELTRKEEMRLRKLAEAVVIKGASSPERLLAETSLFLHRVEANLPETKRKKIRKLHETDAALTGRKVLIVDDDVRNIFAVTSILEQRGLDVVRAESGKSGIAQLKKDEEIDLVLMDIMMPEMDGFETIRAIRELKKFQRLPIIALTAKAMKGDREKCIEAGASDYIAKPVDVEQLLSLLRVWLYRPWPSSGEVK